ncbi:MAG: hypothetical protein K2I12_02305 [Duncaniella sp.]|nr:hypothetical protein [Duncaniella sp.]
MMKKLIISTSLVIAALLGGNSAIAQTSCQTSCPKQEQCAPGKNCGKACANPCSTPCAQRGDSTRCRVDGRRGPGARCNAFEGINLTDNQKKQLEALRTECKAQRSDKKTKACDFRKERLAKVKAILTPEQYTKYLENIATQGGDRGPRNHHRR